MQQVTKLTRARANLVFEQPFFGAIVLRLRMEERSDIQTMAVDGYSIFYNQAFVDSLTEAEVTGVLAHEALHVAMLHTSRAQDFKPDVWNYACDYAINPILLDSGLTIPKDGLINSRFANMTAEKIYAELLEPQNESLGPPKNGEGAPTFGQVMPAPKDKQKNAKQDAKELANTGMIAGKKAGKMPSNLESMLIDTQKSQVDWAEQLREFLTTPIQGDVSWNRPNHRLLEEAYLPHITLNYTANIVILVDTSGSVSNRELQAYASELKPIMHDINAQKITIVNFTYGVDKVTEFDNPDDVCLEVTGRGGTNFKAAFEYVETHLEPPDAILVFSDGEDSIPQDPETPVLWCITGNPHFSPKWGEVIHIKYRG